MDMEILPIAPELEWGQVRGVILGGPEAPKGEFEMEILPIAPELEWGQVRGVILGAPEVNSGTKG
eukprot:1021528-Prorocentrum_minimum.AAC.2